MQGAYESRGFDGADPAREVMRRPRYPSFDGHHRESQAPPEARRLAHGLGWFSISLGLAAICGRRSWPAVTAAPYP
jgi:hypothetical protein